MSTPFEVFKWIAFAGAGLGAAIVCVSFAVAVGHIILEAAKADGPKPTE